MILGILLYVSQEDLCCLGMCLGLIVLPPSQSGWGSEVSPVSVNSNVAGTMLCRSWFGVYQMRYIIKKRNVNNRRV